MPKNEKGDVLGSVRTEQLLNWGVTILLPLNTAIVKKSVKVILYFEGGLAPRLNCACILWSFFPAQKERRVFAFLLTS